jgi:SAM-dependent methyltransferase
MIDLRMPRWYHRRVFTDIFRRNAWGSAESVSGPGSTRARGASISADIIDLLRRIGARSLLDAPCGDFNWIGGVADSVERYAGVDIVAELIADHRRRHGDARRTFLCADFTRDALPAADVIFCRDALVHFSYADIRAALRNFRRSGSRYLLTTTFIAHGLNRNIRTGGWRMLNLEHAPFGFPAPMALIDERRPLADGSDSGKRLALWELGALTFAPS